VNLFGQGRGLRPAGGRTDGRLVYSKPVNRLTSTTTIASSQNLWRKAAWQDGFFHEEQYNVTPTRPQHCSPVQQWSCDAVIDFLQRTTQQWITMHFNRPDNPQMAPPTAFPWVSGPHLMHGSLGLPESAPKRHLDRFSRFCRAHERDHATDSDVTTRGPVRQLPQGAWRRGAPWADEWDFLLCNWISKDRNK